MRSRSRLYAIPSLLVTGVVVLATLTIPESDRAAHAGDGGVRTVWKNPSDAKPLGRSVKKGLAWLVEHQNRDGSWSAGEVSRNASVRRVAVTGRHGTPPVEPPSLGDTCMAALALVRSGSTPRNGPHARPLLRAVLRVCSEIEEAPEEGLAATGTRTPSRIQGKLGTYVDTFLTAMLLSEVKGRMPTRGGEAMLDGAMARVIRKIERAQQGDGRYGGRGWANDLSQALASKGVNRYVQAGGEVSERVLARMEQAALERFDARSGEFDVAGAAGINLYAVAAGLAVMQDAANTCAAREEDLRRRIRSGKSSTDRAEARQILDRYRKNARSLESALGATAKRLDDRTFLAGFGTNGGEEYLSYMSIGESLRVRGGRAWAKWDRTMTESLARTQNPDGSWTGNHCITGRTFCTSAALLTLMTDRTPIPVAVAVTKTVR